MDTSIEQIHSDALEELKKASSEDSVKEIATRYLGRKGRITLFLRGISELPAKERPEAGKKANQVKKALEQAFSEAAGPNSRSGAPAPDHPDQRPHLRDLSPARV